jgi:hypothetical protein
MTVIVLRYPKFVSLRTYGQGQLVQNSMMVAVMITVRLSLLDC